MSCRIGTNQNKSVFFKFIEPVKITAHNIPGVEKYKCIFKSILQLVYIGQNTSLNPLGIVNAVGYLNVLKFDFALLFHHNTGSGSKFFFKVFLDLLLRFVSLPYYKNYDNN